MKKRLEAELISIAHRVLKLKNKSEIDQLHAETHKLYQVLTVLKFYNDNIDVAKSTISENELHDLLDKSTENESIGTNFLEIKTEVKVENTSEIDEQIEEVPLIVEEEINENEEEPLIVEEEINEVEEELNEQEQEEEIDENEEELSDLKEEIEISFEPNDENSTENKEEIKKTDQFSFQDLLGNDYVEPVFIKPSEVNSVEKQIVESESSKTEIPQSNVISVGLNDKIGFVNYLFNGSNEDYNRVISQLNTFDSFKEAEDFITDFVKPDYNNWEGVEDYEQRFLEIVEKKFE
jgi:hypothetical protein